MQINLFKNWGWAIKKCVYQFIYDKNDSHDTKIIKYFIIHGLGLCINVDSYVAHLLYVWSFSNIKSVLIDIKKNKYFLSLNRNTTIFAWEAGNFNKNTTKQLDSLK